MILVSLDFWIGTAFGVIAGAYAKYLADKWTDKRRKKEAASDLSDTFQSIYSQIPKLIDEMKDDLSNNPLVREFILLKRGVVFSYNPNKNIFTYYYDDHDDLESAVRILEAHGFVDDITFNNTDRFQMTEPFVRMLKEMSVHQH